MLKGMNRHRTSEIGHRNCNSGFTLVEIIVALLILAIAMTMAWQTFSSSLKAWSTGRAALEKMHYGDFVMDRISSALRSMAFFDTAPEKYGFRMENNPAGLGEHTICWVTGSDAFMPRNEVYGHGLHRIEIGGGRDPESGDDGMIVTVWPYLADEEKVEKRSWFIGDTIKGLSCRVYDNTSEQDEGWTDSWDKSNAIPSFVEITLFADAPDRYSRPMEFKRLIEIPLGPVVTNKIEAAK